jgi:L-alanine-DL-glutamate epimerase-like enolase superfamily enzyme
MKIIDLKATVIEGFGGDWILIRVFTDAGITGLGETFPTWAHQGRVVKEAIHWMKTLLVGENPTNVDRLYTKMYQRQIYRGGSTAGAVTMAISGVEIALWDIAAKALNAPLYKLLGGKHRDKVRVYCDYHGDDSGSPDLFAKRAEEVVAQGFTALKLDVDLTRWRSPQEYHRPMSSAELRNLISLVKAVRETVGEDVDIAVDCHSGFDAPAAIRLARALEPFNLLWLEEPVPPKNIAALAAVTAASQTPICVGENLYTRFEFRDLLEQQAANIIMPDVQKTGGILESKRIADLASTYYVPMAPHCVTSPIGTMASVHLCASLANFLILEYHMIDVPWWQDMVMATEPIVQNGFINVPEAPGLGVELNEKEVVKCLREGESLD